MELLGVLTRQHTVADDRVPVHAGRAACLADAHPFGDVAQDGNHLVLGQLSAKQRRSLALREACFAGPAAQEPPLLRTVPHGDRQVPLAPLSVVGALGILAAKGTQVVRLWPCVAHGCHILGNRG